MRCPVMHAALANTQWNSFLLPLMFFTIGKKRISISYGTMPSLYSSPQDFPFAQPFLTSFFLSFLLSQHNLNSQVYPLSQANSQSLSDSKNHDVIQKKNSLIIICFSCYSQFSMIFVRILSVYVFLFLHWLCIYSSFHT